MHSSTMAHILPSERTVDEYLQRMEPETLSSLSIQQLTEVRRVLEEAIPKQSPKLVDLRFVVDLVVIRYYLVLWVGKDRRQSVRCYPQTPLTRLNNFMAACLILLSLNVSVTASLLMGAYLVKSAAGINLLPGHLEDYVEESLK